MKINRYLIVAILAFIALIFIGRANAQNMTEADIGKIADAIYKVEGGAKAKVPYGILSVKVKNEQEARRVCENTIRNNHKRWLQSNERSYFTFLADRYCPPSADRVGNTNWKKNIHKILGTNYTARFVKPIQLPPLPNIPPLSGKQ